MSEQFQNCIYHCSLVKVSFHATIIFFLSHKELVDEDLSGEGVELDLVSAMKELDIQEKKTSSAEDATGLGSISAASTSPVDSCKVGASISDGYSLFLESSFLFFIEQ